MEPLFIIYKLTVKLNSILFSVTPYLFQVMALGPVTLVPVLIKSCRNIRKRKDFN